MENLGTFPHNYEKNKDWRMIFLLFGDTGKYQKNRLHNGL